jgi:dipeptidase E
MGPIIASGGGGWRGREALAIHRAMIEASGKRRPRLLLITTAGGENPEQVAGWSRYFARRFGCEVDPLYLLGRQPSRREVAEAIRSAEVVYVGGGNTLKMMRRWRFLGTDAELRRAHRRGTVLAGASAGAICWFEHGHSDSMRGYGHDPWEYIRVTGLGLLRGTLCPHYHHEDRREDFQVMIARKGGYGIALDDRCALRIEDGSWRVIAAGRGARAYAVTRHRGEVYEREIPRRRPWSPLAELYEFGGP